jgi:aerobic carbon-monoxide dehydrogenase medium subunit
MYPRAFHYHRANSLQDASALLSQLGDEAKVLAGGQSLIPLMKLRFATPTHLVDLNFIPGTSYIRKETGSLRVGPLTRHAELGSSDLVSSIPILHDCAAGIADVQVRNRGTIGGSLAEADPSGDWATVLLTLSTNIRCLGKDGERTVDLKEFIRDAYTTSLAQDELISEIRVETPPPHSGGAYLAFKRAAPVYPTASTAVQLTMDGDFCADIRIVLGCVGLTPIRATAAEAALCEQPIMDRTVNSAVEAAQSAAEPQSDMRGSADYKRVLVGALLKRAIHAAVRRARGETIELSHLYA